VGINGSVAFSNLAGGIDMTDAQVNLNSSTEREYHFASRTGTLSTNLHAETVEFTTTGTYVYGDELQVLAEFSEIDGCGTIPLRAVLSTDRSLSPDDVIVVEALAGIGLDADFSMVRSLMMPDAAPGRYYMGMILDPEGDVVETDESDNIVWSSGTIQAGWYPPEVVARHVFYNNSAMDGNDPSPGAADDAALAPDKAAMLPGQIASAVNYTNYWRGINGIMVDIGGSLAPPSLDDFRFRVSGPLGSGPWGPAPLPTLSVRAGQGVDGADRVTLIWGDGEILNQWVEVTVLSDAAGGGLGLVTNDLFLFGNAAGDFDSDGDVDGADFFGLGGELGLRGGLGVLAADFDADGKTGLRDFAIMRSHFGVSVVAPVFPVLPRAPEATAEAPAPAPMADQPFDIFEIDDLGDAGDDPMSPAAAEPLAANLSNPFAQPLPIDSYIPEPQAAPEAETPLAATSEYDLRPLNDMADPSGGGEELLADLLAESGLAISL